MKRIWVDGWQMECCGDPFEVGSVVAWRLFPVSDLDFVTAVIGEEEARALTDREEHHDEPKADIVPRKLKIRSIRAAFCIFAARSVQEPKALSPVPGSGILESTTRADGFDQGTQGRRFVGYVVEADEAGR